MVSEQEILRSMLSTTKKMLETLGSMQSTASSLKEDLRVLKKEDWEDYEEEKIYGDEDEDDKELWREQAQKKDQGMRERSGLFVGHPEPLPQPLPPASLPSSLSPPLSTPPSTVLPPSRVTKSSNKISITGNLNLVLLWPKPNPENFIWPKTILGITVWPKPMMYLNWSINSTSIFLKTTRNRFWLDDLHRKLPPPRLGPLPLPLPWPPPMLTPLPPPSPAFTPLSPSASTPPPPPLALNPTDIEESVKLLWQKFIKKIDGELDVLDVGGATYVGPEIEVHFNFNSVIELINPKTMIVGIIERLSVVVLIGNGETDTHHYICKKVENKMGDNYEDFTLLSLILMVVVVCPCTYGLINPTTVGNKNSTVTGRLEGFLNRYNSVVSRLVGINRTSYLALKGAYEGLDTRSEVVNFNDERENECPWLLGTRDTSLLDLKLNRRDLQSYEAYWRARRCGTINSFCCTYVLGGPPLVFVVNANEFLFDYFPP